MTKNEKVLEVFRNSPDRWRTPRSIAHESGISITEVTRILERSPDIVKSRKGTERGEPLFARKEKSSSPAINNAPEIRKRDSKAGVGQDERLSTGSKYLLLLPFDSSANRLRETVATAIRRESGEPLFLEGTALKPGAFWVEEVSRLIKISNAVIADLSRQSPNVMFELGIAHALGKPLILLIDEDATTNFPATLAGFYALTYTPDDLSGLSTRLAGALHQVAEQQGAV
jgi:hypothetical protein